MKIDFTCPAELLSVEFSAEKCKFYLHNLVEDDITGAELKLSSFDEDNNLLHEQTIRYNEISVEYHKPQSLEFDIDDVDFVVRRELNIVKIWISGGKLWRTGVANEFTYNINPLQNGRALSSLQMIAGKDAIAYPELDGDIWVCVCGRANRIDEEHCRRCQRSKDDIFENYNKDSVDELVEKIKTQQKKNDRYAIEQANAMKDRQELIEKRKKKHKKHVIQLCVFAVILFIAFLFIWHYGIPAYKSFSIDKHIEQEDYVLAKSELYKLPSRYDISERMKICDYNIAQSDMQTASEESLTKAIDTFEALGDYKDSPEFLLESKYKRANIYFENAEYDKALSEFTSIEHFSDSSLKITEINYNIAIDKLNNGDFQGAKDILSNIPSYADSNDKLLQIDYELGKQAFQNNKLEDALAYFSDSLKYDDASDWYFKTLYSIANKYFEDKNFEKAGENYLEIANDEKARLEYKDAQIKANTCLYEVAKQAMDDGEYEKAANIFGGISDYLDSKNLYINCIRSIALKQLNNGNYDEALAQLAQINEDEEAKDLIQRAKYEQAQSIQDSDVDTAIKLYKEIQDYKDAKELYLSLSYAKAEKTLENGDYDAAALAFAALEDYSDSINRRKDCLYAKAEKLNAEGKLEEAKDIFLSLDDYSDSSVKARDIVVKLAHEYMDKKEYEKAISMLNSIEASDATEPLIYEARYLIATGLIKENKLEEALQNLEQIPDYRDSVDLIKDIRYNLALKYENNGENEKAAGLFAAVGDYKDAKERSARNFDTELESPAMLARKAFSEKNYAGVLDILGNINISSLPEKYEDLAEIFNKSSYILAGEAYANKDVARAYKLYNSIANYEDVKDKLLLDSFRIIGKWQSEDKSLNIECKDDGTCIINDQIYKHFFVEHYRLYVGNDIATLENYYNISKWSRVSVDLKDVHSGNRKTYTMLKVDIDKETHEVSETTQIETKPVTIPLGKDSTPKNTPVPIKFD